MPKVDIRDALNECKDRAGDFCQCGAPAEDGWEPHCANCGSYWRDVKNGLFEDAERETYYV